MILIIEDSYDVNQMLAMALQEAGYETKSVFTGMEGLGEIKKEQYDLIIMDLMLPYMSGDQILSKLREVSDKPVIIISAKDLVRTKVDMLKLGADDYITKPFDLEEVTARVEAVLRRKQIQSCDTRQTSTLNFKNMILDQSSKSITVRNQPLELTKTEYQILELLLRNPEKIFSKANLYQTIWEEEYLGDDNAIKTHMSNLRNKIKAADEKNEYIETVWGLGYRLKKES